MKLVKLYVSVVKSSFIGIFPSLGRVACWADQLSVVSAVGKPHTKEVVEISVDQIQRKVMHRSSVDGHAHATGSCSCVAIHCGSAAVVWRLTAIKPRLERQPTAAFAVGALSFTNECIVNCGTGADRPNGSRSPCPIAGRPDARFSKTMNKTIEGLAR
jgi:hypothetical protein